MRFLVNSNAVKKMALTMQERDMETPRPDAVSIDHARIDLVHTSIHPATEKMYLRSGGLVFASDQAIALVDALRRVNWEYLGRC
jgi:hypothetical protein